MPKWKCPKCGDEIVTEAVFDMDGYFYGNKTSEQIDQTVRLEHLEKIVEHQQSCHF